MTARTGKPDAPAAPHLPPPDSRRRIAELSRIAAQSARGVAHYLSALPAVAVRVELCFGAEGIADRAADMAALALLDAVRSRDPDHDFRGLVRDALDAREAADEAHRRINAARQVFTLPVHRGPLYRYRA